MSLETKHFYEFKNFRLDLVERVLLRDGKPISLTPKAFHLLKILVENHGHIVEKDKLMTDIWADSFVEDGNLAVSARMLRKALNDDANAPTFIETISRRGYRFIAEVRHVEGAAGVNGSIWPENTIRFPGSASLSPESLLPQPKTQSTPLRIVGAAAAPKPVPPGEGDQEIKPPVRPGEEVSHLQETGIVGLVRRKRTVLIAAPILGLFVIAAIALGNYLLRGDASVPGTRSIAVLPLKPINAANRDELYEVGIADALIHRLSSMKGFVVRPLSATRKYADTAQDPLAAGSEQRVDYVLDSNYLLAGGKIRITAQLFNVATGRIEETYKNEKDTANIFAVQDEIADEVGNLLLARFATTSDSPAAKRGTTNEEAYRLYLQGMYLVDKESSTDAKRALEFFDKALSIDPDYAKAWAGKARAHCTFAHWGGNSPVAEFAKARPALERAVALDNNLPEAYGVLGIIKTDYDWNFAEGERQFLRAIQIAPNSDDLHRWYANRLAGQGRSEEAIARIKTAIDINPNSVGHQIMYGRILYFGRQYDDAITQMERVVEMDSARPVVFNTLWLSYHRKGDYPRAFESFKRFQQLIGTRDEMLKDYETLYVKSGWPPILLRYLDIVKADDTNGSAAYTKAVLSALLGQREQSFRYLNDAMENRSLEISKINGDPGLDLLRDDPRFDDLVRRVELK